MMSLLRRTLPCLLAPLFLLAGSAAATVMRPMALAELTASAETIVLGSVVSAESAWDGQHRTIFTTVEIAIEESWKGSVANGRMRVRHLGGVVGDIEMTVQGEARFSPGERVVVFARGGRVIGMGQGKRRLSWDGAAKRWMASAWDRRGTSIAGQPDGSTETMSLEALRAEVRALVQQ